MATLYNSLCNETFASANATGFFSFAPGLSDGTDTDPEGINSYTNNVTWAYTEYQNDTLLQQVLWYNTGGVNYSDPSALGYDVCFVPLPSLNEYATYRAQSDDGDCSVALDSKCISAITTTAKSTAVNYGSNATSAQDESGTVDLCNRIGQAIIDVISDSCSSFFETANDTNSTPQPLTGYGGEVSYLYSGTPACVMSNNTSNFTGLNATSDVYWAVGGQYGPPSTGMYDSLANTVLPTFTIFLPLLNSLGLNETTITNPTSQLSCLRETHFSSGSRVPPPVSAPETKKHLSGGAIAGTVIGSVVGAMLLAAVVVYFLRRRRNRQRALTATAGPVASELPSHTLVEADNSALSELPSKDGGAELDEAHAKHELQAGDEPRHELHGDLGEVAELPGLPVNVEHSSEKQT